MLCCQCRCEKEERRTTMLCSCRLCEFRTEESERGKKNASEEARPTNRQSTSKNDEKNSYVNSTTNDD